MKGRTYRYFDDALFPFGYGLSYTTFELGKPTITPLQHSSYSITVPVKNTGAVDGTEIVQLYIRNLQDPDGPLKSLRAFERVEVKAGQTINAKLTLYNKAFEFWDPETNTMRAKSGKYEILIGTSSADKNFKKLYLQDNRNI